MHVTWHTIFNIKEIRDVVKADQVCQKHNPAEINFLALNEIPIISVCHSSNIHEISMHSFCIFLILVTLRSSKIGS